MLAFLLLAVNLRPGIASVPPILPDLEHHIPLSPTGTSVLAAMPLICFGLVPALTAPLQRRFRSEQLAAILLAVLAAGLVLRAAFPHSLIYEATFLAAAAVALLNVVSTAMIGERFPRQVSLMLGLYSSLLLIGSTAAAMTTAPIYHATGDSFGLALGVWAIPVAVAVVCFVPWFRASVPPRAPVRPAAPRGSPVMPSLIRQRSAWIVTFYWGLQALIVYASLSWLPSYLRGRGVSAVAAGVYLGVIGLAGIPTALVLPRFFGSRIGQRRAIVAVVVLNGAGLVGVAFAPTSSDWLWMVLVGIGQGMTLPLGILFIIRHGGGRTPALSSMAQGTGYLIAALGVFLIGILHATTRSWTAVGVLLAVALAGEIVVGFAASSDHETPPLPHEPPASPTTAGSTLDQLGSEQ